MKLNHLGPPNQNFPLPAARAVLVEPPDEVEAYFGTVGTRSEELTTRVVFPQCLLPGSGDLLEATEIPSSWLSEPTKRNPRQADTDALPEVRQSFASSFLAKDKREESFPNLADKEWEAFAPADRSYNCVANSLGIDDQQVWPGFKSERFVERFQQEGYLILGEMDYSLNPELEKVVLFGTGPDDHNYQETLEIFDNEENKARASRYHSERAMEIDKALIMTHAAPQTEEGLWTHKLGSMEMVGSTDPEDFAGGSYGRPIAVLARLRRADT